jgi:hypothetical protein
MAKFVEVTALLDITGVNDPESRKQILVNVDTIEVVEAHPAPGAYCIVTRSRRTIPCKGTIDDFRELIDFEEAE